MSNKNDNSSNDDFKRMYNIRINGEYVGSISFKRTSGVNLLLTVGKFIKMLALGILTLEVYTAPSESMNYNEDELIALAEKKAST